jgi:hypothetical protein
MPVIEPKPRRGDWARSAASVMVDGVVEREVGVRVMEIATGRDNKWKPEFREERTVDRVVTQASERERLVGGCGSVWVVPRGEEMRLSREAVVSERLATSNSPERGRWWVVIKIVLGENGCIGQPKAGKEMDE